jgi:hypothetical protein
MVRMRSPFGHHRILLCVHIFPCEPAVVCCKLLGFGSPNLFSSVLISCWDSVVENRVSSPAETVSSSSIRCAPTS